MNSFRTTSPAREIVRSYGAKVARVDRCDMWRRMSKKMQASTPGVRYHGSSMVCSMSSNSGRNEELDPRKDDDIRSEKGSSLSKDDLQEEGKLSSEREAFLGSSDRKIDSSESLVSEYESNDNNIDYLMTALLFLSPAFGGMCFGYDIGATSGALVSMTSASTSGTEWYALSSLQSGLVVSLSLAGALIGSFGALLFGDRLGRKRELLLASVLYIVGSITTSLSPGYDAVLLGRMLYGIGIGFAMHGAPAYIAETVPPKIRGLLISLKEAFIVLGILLGYLTSYLCSDTVGGWRIDYGAAAILAVLLGLGMAILPDSPRWLLLSGAGRSAAMDALRKTKGKAAREDMLALEMKEIEDTIAQVMTEDLDASVLNADKGSNWLNFDISEILKSDYRRPLSIGLSLMLFQQITGQPSVLYYAASIFGKAGFSTASSATAISVGLGGFKLLTTGVAVAKVDSWGRRPLLLYGVAAIILSLLALGGVQTGTIPIAPEMGAWAAVIALLTYVGAYQLSFGPVSWLIVGEVFPLRVRGQAIALATLTNFASNFGVSLLLPTLQDNFGANIYFVFAIIGMFAWYIIYSSVPETKGKTLEEIERIWRTEE